MQKRWMWGAGAFGVFCALVLAQMVFPDTEEMEPLPVLEPVVFSSGTDLPFGLDPVADRSFIEFMVNDLVTSEEPFDFERYATVTFTTFELDQISSDGQLDPSIERLYEHGVQALSQAEPFDTLRPWQEGEPHLEGWECGHSTRQLLILSMAGQRLKTLDRSYWTLHAADAVLSCTVCEGEPVEDLYDPGLAWLLYGHGGFVEEAHSTALLIGNVYLMAASMRAFSEHDVSSVCALRMIDALQQEHSTRELVERAIVWMSDEIPQEMIHLALTRAADDALVRGRVDVSVVIRQVIEELWGSTPIYALPNTTSDHVLIPL